MDRIPFISTLNSYHIRSWYFIEKNRIHPFFIVVSSIAIVLSIIAGLIMKYSIFFFFCNFLSHSPLFPLLFSLFITFHKNVCFTISIFYAFKVHNLSLSFHWLFLFFFLFFFLLLDFFSFFKFLFHFSKSSHQNIRVFINLRNMKTEEKNEILLFYFLFLFFFFIFLRISIINKTQRIIMKNYY